MILNTNIKHLRWVVMMTVLLVFGGSMWLSKSARARSDAEWTTSGSNIYSANTGNVGVGNTSPAQKLDVTGNVNASGAYLIGGNNGLAVDAYSNIIVGPSAGLALTTGSGANVFIGYASGRFTTTGSENMFIGSLSGYSNTTGINNTYIGSYTGSFATGSYSTVIGNGAGYVAGDSSTYIGAFAGQHASGTSNTLIGYVAGYQTTTGFNNVMMGFNSGITNVTGTSNTLLGASTDVGAANLINATAIGSNAIVSASNSLVLGNNANVGIGTSSPSSKLSVVGNVAVTGNITATGTVNATYQDVAEWVPSSQTLSGGTVVILDSSKRNNVIPSAKSYDTKVAGVVSERPGVLLGEGGIGKAIIATTGRVMVKVDATHRAIEAGDLLVTSDLSGYAMRSEPVNFGGIEMHRPGTLIGKALEPLAKGKKGEILVLLSLQ